MWISIRVEGEVQYRSLMMAGLHSFRSLSFRAAFKAFSRHVSEQKQNVEKENVITTSNLNKTNQQSGHKIYLHETYNVHFLLIFSLRCVNSNMLTVDVSHSVELYQSASN